MARLRDVIENPMSGERIVLGETGAETGGQYLTGTIHLAAKGAGPREHVHRKIEERFRVLLGKLTRLVRRHAARTGHVGPRRNQGPALVLSLRTGKPPRRVGFLRARLRKHRDTRA